MTDVRIAIMHVAAYSLAVSELTNIPQLSVIVVGPISFSQRTGA